MPRPREAERSYSAFEEPAMSFPWKKVLCPIDFSEPARAAMKVAVDVCR